MRLFLAMILLACLIAAVEGSTEYTKVIPASEVLDKIKAGAPVDYDHVIVEGNLTFNQMPISDDFFDDFLPAIGDIPVQDRKFSTNSSINIKNSAIEGIVSFNDISFLNNVTFSNIEFNKIVKFTGSVFSREAGFSGSRFDRSATFSDSIFHGTVNFIATDFNRSVYFNNSKFERPLWFSDSKFNEDAFITYSTINNTSSFRHSAFNGVTNFSGSNFDKEINFMNSTFNGYVFIIKSKFNQNANFVSCNFNKEISLRGSTFNGIANFNGANFNKVALFEGADFKSLDLSLTKYDALYIRWDSINNLIYNKNYGGITYQLLAENFKKLGFLSDFDGCYYEFRKQQLFHRDIFKDPFTFFTDIGALVFFGYGKKPVYPLIWSIGSILFFGMIWVEIGFREEEILADKYSSARDQLVDGDFMPISGWDRLHQMLSPFLFSTSIFLSGTKLFIDPPEIPVISNKPQSLIKGIMTLERVLGAFFSILFFLAIGGTVVR